jgi:hypothetical protein
VVDNRSAGFYGIGGAFNFKSGDPSGTAAKMSQDKYGSEAMYLPPAEGEEFDENLNNQPYVDRSALLRATLNSLAMSNVASVLNANKHKKTLKEILEEDDEEEENSSENREENKQKKDKNSPN